MKLVSYELFAPNRRAIGTKHCQVLCPKRVIPSKKDGQYPVFWHIFCLRRKPFFATMLIKNRRIKRKLLARRRLRVDDPPNWNLIPRFKRCLSNNSQEDSRTQRTCRVSIVLRSQISTHLQCCPALAPRDSAHVLFNHRGSRNQQFSSDWKSLERLPKRLNLGHHAWIHLLGPRLLHHI